MARAESQSRPHDAEGGSETRSANCAAQSGFVAVCGEVFRRFEDRHSGPSVLLLRKAVFSAFNRCRPQRLCEILHFLDGE